MKHTLYSGEKVMSNWNDYCKNCNMMNNQHTYNEIKKCILTLGGNSN